MATEDQSLAEPHGTFRVFINKNRQIDVPWKGSATTPFKALENVSGFGTSVWEKSHLTYQYANTTRILWNHDCQSLLKSPVPGELPLLRKKRGATPAFPDELKAPKEPRAPAKKRQKKAETDDESEDDVTDVTV